MKTIEIATKKSVSLRVISCNVFNSNLPTLDLENDNSKAWRRKVLDSMVEATGSSMASVSAMYNYAKKLAVSQGKCEQFSRTARKLQADLIANDTATHILIALSDNKQADSEEKAMALAVVSAHTAALTINTERDTHINELAQSVSEAHTNALELDSIFNDHLQALYVNILFDAHTLALLEHSETEKSTKSWALKDKISGEVIAYFDSRTQARKEKKEHEKVCKVA